MKKIFVVEDHEDIRVMYRRLFRKETDIEISETEDAESALEMLPQIKPDLVLVDISLPGMSGLELTEIIRKKYPSMKILIVTGHDEERYYDVAIRAGADYLVSKEISIGLVRKCKEVLGTEE
jgi:DNA-binding NarL/FixJ family response regulator